MRFHLEQQTRGITMGKSLVGYLSDNKKVSVAVGGCGESAHLEIYINKCKEKDSLLKVAQWLQANLRWFKQCGIDAWVVRGESDIDSTSLRRALVVFNACDRIKTSGVCPSAAGILKGAAVVSQAKFCFIGGEHVLENTFLCGLAEEESFDQRLNMLLFTRMLLENDFHLLLDGLCLQSSFDALDIAPETAMLVLSRRYFSVMRSTGRRISQIALDSDEHAGLVFKRMELMLDFMALPAQYPMGGRLFNKPSQTGVQYLAALDHNDPLDRERFNALLGGMIRTAGCFLDPQMAVLILRHAMRLGKKSFKNSTWGVRATRSHAFESLLRDLERLCHLRPVDAPNIFCDMG